MSLDLYPETSEDSRIAIIGMAGRFPGAPDVDALWELSVSGRSGLSEVSGGEPGCVPVRGVVADADRFDAAYFGIPEHEAAVLDRQQRVLLEVAQHAFDDANLDRTAADNVAVYTACAPHPVDPVGGSLAERYERQLAAEAGFASTRLAYRLGLRAEAVTVETACSSSLTAVHMAAQSLLSGQCDMALAGGVSIPPDQDEGYLTEEGMITSPTGQCRPFDSEADGTVPGAGAAIVLLKRYSDAVRDQDSIRAVILGTAANNDGATKLGFMAPSPEGQAEVIGMAHAVAGVPASSIGYVETHGTATKLGDAVEIEGLRRSFALDPLVQSCVTDREDPCFLGSLKANCGHLDRAAGVAGLIRATLALQHKTIPPMAGFGRPNPALDLESGKFAVPDQATPWSAGQHPRRAGVSAFGVGGTNVHVVLEETLSRRGAAGQREPVPDPVLLPLSGHSAEAVRDLAGQLADQLERDPRSDLAGVARTLSTGRIVGEYRSWVVAASASEAVEELRRLPAPQRSDRRATVVFAYPGQGAAFVDGLRDLYVREPVFRAAIDKSAQVLDRHGIGLVPDLYDDLSEREHRFSTARRFQPAMVAVELALTELWASWGVVPDVVLGHSMGELAAAGAAGMLDPDDLVALAARRGAAMDMTRPGANLSVALAPERLRHLLPEDVTICTLNGVQLTTVTGPVARIELLAERLAASDTFFRRLNIPISSHSPAMIPAAAEVREFAARLPVRGPSARVLSNVTGDWADERFGRPDYWSDHLLSQVRFAEELQRVAGLHAPIVIGAGPDAGFSRMIDHEIGPRVRAVIASVDASTAEDTPHAGRVAMLKAAGQAWSAGAAVDISRLGPVTRKAAIPLTSFDHGRLWPHQASARRGAAEITSPARRDDPGSWLYECRFREVPAVAAQQGAARQIAARQTAPRPAQDGVAWAGREDPVREQVMIELARVGRGLRPYEEATRDAGRSLDVLWWVDDLGADLLVLAWRLGEDLARNHPGSRVWMLARPRGARSGIPAAADLALAVARVLPQELPGTTWHLVRLGTDVDGRGLAAIASGPRTRGPETGQVLDLDGDAARELVFEHAWPHWQARPLRENGCYVITGGMGIVGRSMAMAIAREVRANVTIIGRRSAAEVRAELDALAEVIEPGGSRLAYETIDVGQAEHVGALFGKLRAAHGRIDGVVHAAGLTDRNQFTVLKDSTAREVGAVAHAKVAGCANLETALHDDDADFILLCSSLSVALGGLRFGPYVAANAALDEFARTRHARGDRRWISVEWDAWSESVRPDAAGPARYALTPADGHEVLRRLLSVRGPVVAISTGELPARIAEISAQVTQPAIQSEGEVTEGLAIASGDAVAVVLKEILGRVPDDDEDLRATGVESLAVLQIVTRLRNMLGISIPFGEAFSALSVAGLEDLVARYRGSGAGSGHQAPGTASVSVVAHGPQPVTAIQRRWLDLLDERYGGIDLVVEVQAECGAAELATAVGQVIERHSGLRTTFTRAAGPSGGNWLQAVSSGCEVQVSDLEDLPAADQETALSALVRANADRWFEPSDRPPFEVTVASLGPGRNALVLHAHHVLFDGWSSSIFLRDVARALRGELTGRAPQYLEHARAHAAYLAGDRARADIEHWRKHFAGAPGPTRIAADHAAPAAGSGPHDYGSMLELSFGTRLSTRLKEAAARERVTVFALMMSAYAMLIHRLTEGAGDLIVGTTAAGRPTVESEETVGVFVSPFPLRLAVHPGQSVRSLLWRTHDTLAGFHEHGELPLAELIGQVEPFTGLGPNDAFHCYLLYQNYWRPSEWDIEFRRMNLQGQGHHRLMREFEIVLEDGPEGLMGELWYLPSRFSAGTAAAWAQLYRALLTNIASDQALDLAVSDFIAAPS